MTRGPLAMPSHAPPSAWVIAVAQVSGTRAGRFRGKSGRRSVSDTGASGTVHAEDGHDIPDSPMGSAILPGRTVAPGRRRRYRSVESSNNPSSFSTGRGKSASIVTANVRPPLATATDGVWQAGSSTLSRNGLRTTTRFTGSIRDRGGRGAAQHQACQNASSSRRQPRAFPHGLGRSRAPGRLPSHMERP